MGRRGKGVVLAVVAAVTAGIAVSTVAAKKTDEDAQRGGAPPASAVTEWDHAPPETMDDSGGPSFSERPPGAPESGAGDGSYDRGHEQAEGRDQQKPGPRPPGDSSSPPEETADGGSSEGGPADGGSGGDPGGGKGGTSGAGGTQGGGGSDGGGDDDPLGALLGGLLNGVLGGDGGKGDNS
ncbi:hypothetical protein [Streptomyces winkii]|uniref:hypothetical protein n=1 Tax=Streptomyces winkii TaxID=3051178 RepID=UPI0028D12926|nr:hypothetical protein [Streptomyces sp. DSM 40971]